MLNFGMPSMRKKNQFVLKNCLSYKRCMLKIRKHTTSVFLLKYKTAFQNAIGVDIKAVSLEHNVISGGATAVFLSKKCRSW